jgi:uncharacterized coiled-coil DUF342 family protein
MPYVVLAAVLAFAGLSLAVAYYKNSAARAEAEATLARDQRDRAVNAVKEAQASIERLKELSTKLDAAIVERDKRAKELEAAKRKAHAEINELKKSLAAADQACLDRDLPSALLERLRL